MAGESAVQLIRLVNGDGASGPSRDFESSVHVCAANCLEAVANTLSHIEVQNVLPPPSPAAAALIRRFGSWYVLHKGFAYRALADGWLPYEEGSRTQEKLYLPVPLGHEICPDDNDSREVCAHARVFRKICYTVVTSRSSPSIPGTLALWLLKAVAAITRAAAVIQA